MRRSIIALVLLSLSPARAFAWGSEGHRIIADIAEQYLEPATVRQVRNLLSIENDTSLAEVANWPDQIRRQRPETAPWHFVDIPLRATAYDPSRDCPHSDCVVGKIEQFAAELRDPRLSPWERLDALKFVVHFVGDVHQPLHASNNRDRGGNGVRLEFMGRRTNLHAVWDTGILAPAVKGDERAYALQLARQITPAKLSAWQSGEPDGWANESHAIAVTAIYGRLPHSGALPEGYEDQALPIVDRQLEKAGVRLAWILNKALDHSEK